MKILLTAHHADQFRGVELFNWTLAKELSKHHEVSFFSYEYGIVSDKIAKYATLVKKLDQTKMYDLGIISHNTCYREVSHLCREKLFISHGIFSPLDDVPDTHDCISYGVSEEVQARRNTDKIIRQPVDPERYADTKGGGNGILYLTNHPSHHALYVLERMGMPLFQCKEQWEVEKYINRADIVVTSARGAIEAMMCKKPVIILSPYGFDGYCGEYWEMMKNNYGGRRYRKDLTVDSMAYEMDKKRNVPECYEHAIEFHSVDKILERLFREL